MTETEKLTQIKNIIDEPTDPIEPEIQIITIPN